MRTWIAILFTIGTLIWTGLAFCGEIHDAAKNGEMKKVKTLLKDNPNLVFSKDTNGLTPLFFAVSFGHKDVAELLLANNADVNDKDSVGNTPLTLAVIVGQKDMVELLLTNKANINAKDSKGNTPLSIAVAISSWDEHHKEVANLLSAYQANLNAMEKERQTPLPTAAAAPLPQVLSLNSENTKQNWSKLHEGLTVEEVDQLVGEIGAERIKMYNDSLQMGALINASEQNIDMTIQTKYGVLKFHNGKLKSW